MSLQTLIVVVAVVAATGYVTWGFMTGASRQRVLDLLARCGVLRGYAARHRASLAGPACAHCASSAAHRPVRR